ncbi:MAG TPA: hypothetical protein V6C72_03570 [Chroococcales cyanobacterium]
MDFAPFNNPLIAVCVALIPVCVIVLAKLLKRVKDKKQEAAATGTSESSSS